MKFHPDARGYAILAGCCFVVAAFGAMATLRDPGPQLAMDGCPANRAPAAHTILLVDATDSIANPGGHLASVVEPEILGLRQGEKMTVLSLDPNSDRLVAEHFSRCSPGRGSEFSNVSDNPNHRQEQFDESFGAPLTAALAAVARSEVTHRSPLIEVVQRISSRPDFGSEVSNRKLIFVSDGLQFTPQIDHYRSVVDYSTYRSGPRFQRIDLSGVAVRMLYVARGEQAEIQTEAHRTFWLDFFAHAGADPKLEWW
jgi:hypothetical protein